MIFFACHDYWKKTYGILLLALVSFNTTAIQPISEDHLAVATGDQSPVKLLNASLDETSDLMQVLDDEKLNFLEKQITLEQKQQYIIPLETSLELKSKTLQQKQEALVIQTQKNAGDILGLEGVSMMWDNGKLITITDLDKMNDYGFNHETGSYELKNVRGTVTTVTSLH